MRKGMHYGFAAILAFASAVEWAHFQRFEKARDWRTITTACAAIACGYMAGEALQEKWPSW